jgi:hypothetical protein
MKSKVNVLLSFILQFLKHLLVILRLECKDKIREVGKMRQFKRVFRSNLVQHVFYSVEEYMLS